MNTGYNEIEQFYKFLYKKPKYIVFEYDHIIDRNYGKYKNDGLICYTNEMSDLMRTKAFRRMNKIFQLGTKFMIDPNLKHSRGIHSKGTYARAVELCMHILENDNIKNMVENHHYEKYFVAEVIRGLTHDIGQGPFSHTMETICELPKGFHEDLGARLIQQDEELREALNKIWPNLPEIMEEAKQRNFLGLNQLFEGQLDIDRGDFVARDGWALQDRGEISDIVTYLFQNVDIKNVTINGRSRLAPTFSNESLPYIERVLDYRFNNYQKYLRADARLIDYVFKGFTEMLLKSDEDFKLKTFLTHNYKKKPEEVDLQEYVSYNDIEFLKGIIDVFDNTNNEKLKNMARLCIPDADSFYALYWGLMASKEDVNEDGNIDLNANDREFFKRIANIPGGSTLKLIKERYVLEKCDNEKDLRYKISQIRRIVSTEEDRLSEYGITYDISKNSLYKNKPGEEIFIADGSGKFYTYDKHPDRTLPLKKFTNAIIIVDKDMLKEKVKDEGKIGEIMKLVTNRLKVNR